MASVDHLEPYINHWRSSCLGFATCGRNTEHSWSGKPEYQGCRLARRKRFSKTRPRRFLNKKIEIERPSRVILAN